MGWFICSVGKKFMRMIDVIGLYSDDCLNLNVWIFSFDLDLKLLVMVWIYGGVFVFGVGLIFIYDGVNFVKKVVVVVLINY